MALTKKIFTQLNFEEQPAQPVQWNLFIPFHQDEISFALISSGWQKIIQN
jgi:hypothetical protein